MSMNIKSEAAHQLARELAGLTGESMTTAIITALRERLDRVKRSERHGLSERLLAIGRDCAAHLSKEYRSFDYDAFLYDEKTGLPRDC
jgi:antitoxin VapB